MLHKNCEELGCKHIPLSLIQSVWPKLTLKLCFKKIVRCFVADLYLSLSMSKWPKLTLKLLTIVLYKKFVVDICLSPSISKCLTKVDLKKASKQFQLRKTQCYNFRSLSNVSFQRRQNSSEKNSFEIFQFPYFSKQEWLNSKT